MTRYLLVGCALLVLAAALPGAAASPGAGWLQVTGIDTGDAWVYAFDPVFLDIASIQALAGGTVDLSMLPSDGAYLYSFALYNEGFEPDITRFSVGYPVTNPFAAWTGQTGWSNGGWSTGTGSVVYDLGGSELTNAITPGQYSTNGADPAFWFATASPPGGTVPLGILDGGHVGFGEAPGPSPVPEPGSLVLLVTGLAGALPFMRKRRQ